MAIYDHEAIAALNLKDIHLGAEPFVLNEYVWWAAIAVIAILLLAVSFCMIAPQIRFMTKLIKAYRSGEGYAARMNAAIKDAAMFYLRDPKIGAMSSKPWLSYLDSKGYSKFSKFSDMWDAVLYGQHPLTNAEKRSLLKNGLGWIFSQIWRLRWFR